MSNFIKEIREYLKVYKKLPPKNSKFYNILINTSDFSIFNTEIEKINANVNNPMELLFSLCYYDFVYEFRDYILYRGKLPTEKKILMEFVFQTDNIIKELENIFGPYKNMTKYEASMIKKYNTNFTKWYSDELHELYISFAKIANTNKYHGCFKFFIDNKIKKFYDSEKPRITRSYSMP